MKKFDNHLLPNGLWYLVQAYLISTEWQWYEDNNIKYESSTKLTTAQLSNLIATAISWSVKRIQYNTENT